MGKRKKPVPPQTATVEAIWWRDPYARERTAEPPQTFAYCTIGIVWKETKEYLLVAREVNAQSEDYLSERDDQKIYHSLIYKRVKIGEVEPYDPFDDDEEESNARIEAYARAHRRGTAEAEGAKDGLRREVGGPAEGVSRQPGDVQA